MSVAADALEPLDVHAPPRARLSWREHSRSRIGGWLDHLAMSGMWRAFDAALMPSPEQLAAVRSSAAPYVSPTLAAEPRRFFGFLDEAPKPIEVHARERRAIAGGVVARHVFASPYVPFDRASPAPDDPWMPIEHWRHDRPAPATVLAVHGFTMGDPDVDAILLMAPEWFALGLDVVLVTLPFHGKRTPATARYSGELFASWNVGALNEAVRHSIFDLERVTRWLRSEGESVIGVVGLSLGGYLAALLAELVDELACVIPIAAPVHLGAFPSALFARSRHARRSAPPLTARELEDAYRVHSPLTHRLALPRDRALIVAGRGDRIVPPDHALNLWRHWRRPSLHWFGGSHVTPFRRAAVFAAGVRHLRTIGILS
jgi:pimeloyl-ACP methyl ester carboxylesterase